MTPISILILTLNEEINLADCMDSCAWSDDIVVFDSLSTDGTRDIALRKGGRIVERKFDNYAAQRNAALDSVGFKHPWVLMVDADERIPADLAAEMRDAVSHAADDVVLFRMRRKDYFLGKWLRRSSGYPSWFGRLARRGKVRFERDFNEECVPDGKVAYIDAHLAHFPFNKGISFWFDRHNRYSSMEAAVTLNIRSEPVEWRSLVQLDPIARRRALKQIGYRLPFRPVIAFLYLYVFRLGFLDGRAGLCFSAMRSTYEFFIDLKVLEAKRRQRGLPV